VDLHTVGAGGGSLARLDAGGALRVGPESAGADPGPACYGRGERPTVTDAQLVLGRLRPDAFLDGRMALDVDAARRAIAALGGLRRVEALAADIIRVSNANMERAIRVISVERGHDPRDFALLAFGGAGPLHACDLAEALRIPRVVVPPHPGVLSAFGMVVADLTRDYVAAVLRRLDGGSAVADEVEARLRVLEQAAREEFAAAGHPSAGAVVQRSLDMRYAGQSYEVGVPVDAIDATSWANRFHAAHAARFGHGHPGRAVEVVNARLRFSLPGARIDGAKPGPKRIGHAESADAIFERADVWFGGPHSTAIVRREALAAGALLAGPAVVVQMDTTTVVNPGWQARVDEIGNLLLERA
ncbi:MAG TPA: hydantoinase/oxoprolinase family protein, partial [Dehalococcoidia bacterium]|nr:hydantoinase/oxoprolinase family protein [Dehalococcoidia bacterium]